MNSNFKDWYLTVCISPKEGQVANRMEGIQKFSDKATSDDIVNLVKLYYGMEPDAEALNRFVDVFTQTDESFSAKQSQEVAFLAGATLLRVAENIVDYDSLAEQLVLSTGFCHKTKVTPEVKLEIQKQYDRDRIALRESLVEKIVFPEADNPLLKEFEEYIDENELDTTGLSKLQELLRKFDNKLNHLQTYISNLQETQSIYREDSQILWWMTSKWSNILKCHLEALEKKECCLMIGYEAASLIANSPGPYSMEGVLKQIIGVCKGADDPVSLADLIMNTSKTFKDMIITEMKNSPILAHLPLCNAIVRAENTENTEEWYPKFKRECITVGEEISLYPSQYAFQMYIECMAQKCYVELKAK